MCQPMVASRFTLCNCRQILDFSELIIPYFSQEVNLSAPRRVPRLIQAPNFANEIKSPENLGICTGICSALQGFRRESGGAMFRTHFARLARQEN